MGNIGKATVACGLTLLIVIGWRVLTQPSQPAPAKQTVAPTPATTGPTVSVASKPGLPIGRSAPSAQTEPTELEKTLLQLAQATTPEHRFYVLNDAAKESFAAGQIDDARRYATEELQLAQQFPTNWNYGNAIHDGNMVLGRIAVKTGDLTAARDYLLKAGQTKGSPQLDSFGPNMSLAKDLLEKGDRETVLQYFDLCRQFWTSESNQLNEWSMEVSAGKTPDFGANLLY